MEAGCLSLKSVSLAVGCEWFCQWRSAEREEQTNSECSLLLSPLSLRCLISFSSASLMSVEQAAFFSLCFFLFFGKSHMPKSRRVSLFRGLDYSLIICWSQLLSKSSKCLQVPASQMWGFVATLYFILLYIDYVCVLDCWSDLRSNLKNLGLWKLDIEIFHNYFSHDTRATMINGPDQYISWY